VRRKTDTRIIYFRLYCLPLSCEVMLLEIFLQPDTKHMCDGQWHYEVRADKVRLDELI